MRSSVKEAILKVELVTLRYLEVLDSVLRSAFKIPEEGSALG